MAEPYEGGAHVKCDTERNRASSTTSAATFEDLLKPPRALTGVSRSEAFRPRGGHGPSHVPSRAVPAAPQALPSTSVTQPKETPPVTTIRHCKSLVKCQKVIQHSPDGGLYVSVAASSEGLLAITDRASQCVHLLTKEGRFVRSIGAGVLGGMLSGVAFDHKDNIWVTDWEHGRVLKLSQDGRLLARSEKYNFKFPYGVGVSPEGLIYICDHYRNRVAVHDTEGKFLRQFGSQESGKGCFNSPRDVAFDSDGLVYVTDSGNNRVCVWSKEGMFKRDFKTKFVPFYIAAYGNHLFITSYTGNAIMVYGLQGELVHEFRGRGSDSGQFDYLMGICIDNTGQVFVADYQKRRIQVFH